MATKKTTTAAADELEKKPKAKRTVKLKPESAAPVEPAPVQAVSAAPAPEFTTMTISITKEDRKKLKQVALSSDTTVSNLVREWIATL